jgi:hypothetical protein
LYLASKGQILKILLRDGGGLITFQSCSLNNDPCYAFYPHLGHIESQIVSRYVPPYMADPRQKLMAQRTKTNQLFAFFIA